MPGYAHTAHQYLLVPFYHSPPPATTAGSLPPTMIFSRCTHSQRSIHTEALNHWHAKGTQYSGLFPDRDQEAHDSDSFADSVRFRNIGGGIRNGEGLIRSSATKERSRATCDVGRAISRIQSVILYIGLIFAHLYANPL